MFVLPVKPVPLQRAAPNISGLALCWSLHPINDRATQTGQHGAKRHTRIPFQWRQHLTPRRHGTLPVAWVGGAMILGAWWVQASSARILPGTVWQGSLARVGSLGGRVEMFESCSMAGFAQAVEAVKVHFWNLQEKLKSIASRRCRQARWFSPAGFSGTRTSLGPAPSDPAEARKPAATPASSWGVA